MRPKSQLKASRTETAAKIVPTSSAASKRNARSPSKTLKPKKSSQKPNQTLRIGSQAFNSLRNEWYSKLKESGFKDIEKTAQNETEPRDLLNVSSLRTIARNYSAEGLHYYRKWSCWLVHNPKAPMSKRDRRILELYAEGVSYRDIVKQVQNMPNYPTKANIKAISILVNRYKPIVDHWNRTDHKGLDFSADVGDSF